MKALPVGPHCGEWDAVSVPSERSIVPLPDDTFDEMLPTFTNKTAFVNLFPSLQINVTWGLYVVDAAHSNGPNKYRYSDGILLSRGVYEAIQL